MRKHTILPVAVILLMTVQVRAQFQEMGSCWHQSFTGITTLENAGPKWMGWSYGDTIIQLFNADMSTYRELHFPPSSVGVVSELPFYITEDLFDTDPSTIEWLARMQADGVDRVVVLREDGSVVYSWPPGSIVMTFANWNETPVFNHSDGHAYMEISYAGQNHAFQLPGHLPCAHPCGALTPTGMVTTLDTRSAGLDIFPNPSVGSVTITVRMPQGVENAALAIVDAAGRTVRTIQVGRSERDFNVTGLGVGSYTCTLTTDGFKVAERLIAVDH